MSALPLVISGSILQSRLTSECQKLSRGEDGSSREVGVLSQVCG